jgi:predicted metal-dependent peptidase
MSDQATTIKPDMKPAFDKEFLDYMRVVLMELRNHNPFFGVLATELWIAGPTESIPTIGVSEKGVVVYNEAFMKKLPVGELIAVLVHEALHVALDYWKRFAGHDPEIANWAHDFAINSIIIKGMATIHIKKTKGDSFNISVKLPDGGLFDSKYDNNSGEEIYHKLYDGVKERTASIREQLKNAMGSKSSADQQRDAEIKKEARQSVADGMRVVAKKRERLQKELGIYKDLDAEREEFRSLIKNNDGFSMVDNLGEVDRPDNNPFDKDGAGNADKKAGSFGHKAKPQLPGSHNHNPFSEANEKLNKQLMEDFKEYMGKEMERITCKVDGEPEPTTKENNLRELDEALGKTGDEYVDEVTKDPGQGQEGDDPSPDQGDNPQDGAQSKPGGDSAEKGSPGGNDPGDQPGEGQGQPGQGQPTQGQGQSDPSSTQGDPSQGEGGNGQPGKEGQAQDNASNGAADGAGGQPQSQQGGQQENGGQGQGQAGTEGQTGPEGSEGAGQSGGQGSGSGGNGPMPESHAKSDVADALGNLEKEIQNALQGKENGTGLDNNMTSGQNMMEQGAWDKAIKEIAKEIGAGGMQGDINIDCSDIQGNPFKAETPEKTQERKRQMLSQATKQDKIHGGNGWGSLPAWAKDEINGILNPPLRLGQKIKKVVGNYGRPDSATFKRSNKRNSFREYTPLLPGKKKNTSRIYILMDTSGSMFNPTDLDNLRMAMGLVKRLATSKGMEVLVVQCDAGLQRVMTTKEALAAINENKFKVNGGGGSDFSEGFEYIWKEMKEKDALYGAPIIVFTDGGITVPEMPPKNIPRHQTLWITTPGQRAPTEKWGEHLILADLA